MSPELLDRIVAIGDVQGCQSCLEALVAKIDAADAGHRISGADRPPVRLWLTGDLVNRGPKSLDTLRWAIANRDRVTTVLGNHDLHLLAVAAGVRPQHRSDTLDDILHAPDAADLIDYVRGLPLAHLANGHLLVHAGVMPQWSAEKTVELAAEVQAALSGPRWTDFLRVMYGNEPARWSDTLAGADRLRVIVNTLTRIRFCRIDGTMDFSAKMGADAAPPGHMPWFDVPGRETAGVTVVFGHWSTLGLLIRPDLLGLDTGCVWGGALTGVSLGDRTVVAVRCDPAQDPLAE